MPRIVEHQINQLERAFERAARQIRTAVRPLDRAADLAANVTELLGEPGY